MAQDLDLDDVVEHFTLVGEELELLRNKTGATRLGFALILKFLLWKGRFPRSRHELADNAIDHVARQVCVPASEFGSYDTTSRTAQRHRTEARRHTGFRQCSVADAEKLAFWLAGHVAESERQEDRVREALLVYCRDELIEPPSTDRVTEIVRSALHQAEQTLMTRVTARLDPGAVARLEALVAIGNDPDLNTGGNDILSEVKSAPGNVSLDSVLVEVAKLNAVRSVRLSADLFADVAAKVVSGWRARAAVESPSHLRDHSQPIRLVLLSALLFEREREITDALVELLISTVNRINVWFGLKIRDRHQPRELAGSFMIWVFLVLERVGPLAGSGSEHLKSRYGRLAPATYNRNLATISSLFTCASRLTSSSSRRPKGSVGASNERQRLSITTRSLPICTRSPTIS